LFDDTMIELRRPVERTSIRDLAVAAHERHLAREAAKLRDAWIKRWITDEEYLDDEGYVPPTNRAAPYEKWESQSDVALFVATRDHATRADELLHAASVADDPQERATLIVELLKVILYRSGGELPLSDLIDAVGSALPEDVGTEGYITGLLGQFRLGAVVLRGGMVRWEYTYTKPADVIIEHLGPLHPINTKKLGRDRELTVLYPSHFPEYREQF
jgi:hypothetical protein